MDRYDGAEAGEVDLLALERTQYSLPCGHHRCGVRLLRRHRGACADMVAASWTGVALPIAERAEAHVAPIHHRQHAVPLEYAEGEMLNIELKYSVTDIYCRFIQFPLGVYEGKEFLDGSALKDLDWAAFYEFAKKQTLVGVVFDGIQKLLKDAAPNLELLMRWFGINQKIMQRNNVLNEATVVIYNKVKDSGYSCCILKGQGNAVMYPNPLIRIPGVMWMFG